MSRPFEFSAWSKFTDQPLSYPGKIYDRADNDGTSYVPQGGPVPYGRVVVSGISGHPGTMAGGGVAWGHGDRLYTNVQTCSLPDKDGDFLKNGAGVTYKAAGLSLPLDPDGKLIVLGIGMWTEHGSCINDRLKQPFGLGDIHYQPEKFGQIGLANAGRLWVYCETDINIGDKLFFRTTVPTALVADGKTLLGGFSNVGGAEFQPFTAGSVYRPGPAGGAFVINLTFKG